MTWPEQEISDALNAMWDKRLKNGWFAAFEQMSADMPYVFKARRK